jgi:DNA polymerase III subunit delta'
LEIDACGVCPSCRRFARGIHADLLLVEPGDTGSIKIEQVREIIDRAAYRPFEGRRRVVVIDDADALVPAAQNALLKTLEEPPSLSQFLLVTSRPDVLLPTVRSRCPCLRFRPLDIRDIAGALVARGRSEAEARALAAASDGSLGRALESSAADVVAAREVAQAALARAAASNDPVRRLDGARDLLAGSGSGNARSDRDQLASNLRAIASLLRDVELLSTGARRSAQAPAALANSDMRQALDELVPAYQGDRGLRAFTAVDRALGALERNAGVKIVADWVALQL